MLNEFATFAVRFGIPAADAYVLPALFERSAQLVNLPLRQFVADATYNNPRLGQYMADAARRVAAIDRADIAA